MLPNLLCDSSINLLTKLAGDNAKRDHIGKLYEQRCENSRYGVPSKLNAAREKNDTYH